VDAGALAGQAALVERIARLADPDLVLEVRLIGVRGDDLDVSTDEVERELADRFFRLRVRDGAAAALPDGPLAPPDTIVGALVRDLRASIAEAEAKDRHDDSLELRDALRLARLMLDGHEVTL
jgi:hypothetical protein